MSLQAPKMVDAILKSHPGSQRDHLIPILQEVQEKLGYLSEDAVVRIGRHMSIPASKIYGVATGYKEPHSSRWRRWSSRRYPAPA